MCNFCDIENKIQSVDIFSEEEENRILNAIYLGFITPDHLDYSAYIKIATFIEEETYRGYGKNITESVPGDKDESLLKGFKFNIYAFSAAKLFQMWLEISKIQNKPIDEWLIESRVVFKKYCSEWLAIEGDSAYHQGLSAKRFNDQLNWSYE